MRKLTYLLTVLMLAIGGLWTTARAITVLDEGFEVDLSNWTTQGTTSYTGISSTPRTGSKGFYFYYGYNAQYLISNELSVPESASSDLAVEFFYKKYSYGTESFKVGYSTTDNDVNSFTWDAEVTVTNTSWQKYTPSISFPKETKYISICYTAIDQYYLYIDDIKVTCSVSGPNMSVLDGEATLASGYSYNFGLATSGTTKTFTLKNDGTEAAPVAVAHTGNFGAELSANSIPAGGEVTLTVTMPEASGSDVITISSTSAAISDFVLNVSGTVRDPNKFFESLLVSAMPDGWSTSGTWYYSTTNGAYNSAYYESYNYRLITPKLLVADGETFIFEAQGTYSGYQGVKLEYSADGTTWIASNTTTTVSGDWRTFIVNDIPAGNYYIALHGWQVRLRNFYGGVLPAMPKDLKATNVTDEAATISWNAYSNETAWQVSYSTTPGNPDDGTKVDANTNSAALSNLNPQNIYYVSVRIDNGNGAYGVWSSEISFRTQCGIETTSPWIADFTGLDGDIIPECWDNSASTCTLPWDNTESYIWGTYKSSGNVMLRLYNAYINADGAAIINTPRLKLPNSNEIEFIFDYSHKANCGAFKVNMSVEGGDFVEIGSYTNSGSTATSPGTFTLETIDLSNYNLADKTVQFQFCAAPNYGSGAIFIDNVKVRRIPTCFAPKDIVISNVGSESANLSWTAGKDETAWKVQYKADGASSWSEKAVSENPSCSLTGLNPTTTYYVQVIADCDAGETSEASAQSSFTTTCAAEAMPYEESFSSTSALPDCWNAPTPTSTTYRWKADYQYSGGAYNYWLRLRGSSNSAELSLVPITLSEDAVLKFNWKNSSSSAISANVWISTDGGSTKENIYSLSAKNNDWTPQTVDLSDYTGETVIIYFISTTGNSTSSYAYLDDVQVIAKPCEELTGLAAASTIDGGTINWTGNAKALRYKADGANDWTTVYISGSSYLLTGLQASSAYNVQVQAACAEGAEDLWSATLTFTTKCAATNILPYENNFEGEEVEEMPACWDRISTSAYPQVVSGAATYGGSGKALCFSGNTDQKAVLPALTQALKTLSISFYYKSNYSSHYEIGYLEADGATFHTLASLPASTSFGSEPYELDLASISDDAAYLAILYTGATSSYATGYIDNVVVRKTPTCFKPASAAVASYTDNSAVINWTASTQANESQYQYVCVPANTNPDWDEATLTDQLTATVENLTAHKAYDFYVRSYCGEEQSDAVKVSFTTACSVISALPWEYDFEDDDTWGYPECWNKFEHGYSGVYVVDNSGKTAPYSLYALGGSTSAYTTVILPKFAAALNTLAISFQYSGDEGDAYGKVKVGYMTNIENESSFVVVKEFAPADAYKQAVVSFAGISASANIAIRYEGGSSEGDLYIDDIRVARTEVFNDDANNESRFATLNTEGATIDVIFNRTLLGNGDYNTFCLPFNLDAAQLAESPIANFKLKAFDYATIENGELLIAIAPASSIEAGVPYFIANNANEANLTEQFFKDVVITADAPGNVDNGDVTFQGVFNPVDLNAQAETDVHNQLFLAKGNTIYWPAQDKTVKGFRAYFQVAVGGLQAIRRNMPARIVEHVEVATGIEDAQSDVQSLKLLENGTVIIIRNGVKYNIQGQVIQ